ncbi:hypothetical protein PIB30_048590, partial [Stylosanthes scabra]|nr:hypothetical protein [Stylosanthes scabra]
ERERERKRESTPDRNRGSLTEQRRQSARLPPPTTNLVFASPPNCVTFGSVSSWPCGTITEDRRVGSELPHGATPSTVSATKAFHQLCLSAVVIVKFLYGECGHVSELVKSQPSSHRHQ